MTRSKQNKRKIPKAARKNKIETPKAEKATDNTRVEGLVVPPPQQNEPFSKKLRLAQESLVRAEDNVSRLQSWFANGLSSDHPDYHNTIRIRTLLHYYTAVVKSQQNVIDSSTRLLTKLAQVSTSTKVEHKKAKKLQRTIGKAQVLISDANVKIEEYKQEPFGMTALNQLMRKKSKIPPLFYRIYKKHVEKFNRRITKDTERVNRFSTTTASPEDPTNSSSPLADLPQVNLNNQSTATSNHDVTSSSSNVQQEVPTLFVKNEFADVKVKMEPIYDYYVDSIVGVGNIDDPSTDDDSERDNNNNDSESDILDDESDDE